MLIIFRRPLLILPHKSFFSHCAVENISPILTDPERARRMEVRRILLEEQAEQIRSHSWN